MGKLGMGWQIASALCILLVTWLGLRKAKEQQTRNDAKEDYRNKRALRPLVEYSFLVGVRTSDGYLHDFERVLVGMMRNFELDVTPLSEAIVKSGHSLGKVALDLRYVPFGDSGAGPYVEVCVNGREIDKSIDLGPPEDWDQIAFYILLELAHTLPRTVVPHAIAAW